MNLPLSFNYKISVFKCAMSQGASSVDEEYERRPVKLKISLINLFFQNKLTVSIILKSFAL